MAEQEFLSLGDIFKDRAVKPRKKPPSYPWQDLALEVIAKLGIPNFKRNSVFKICKDNPAVVVRRALNDTLELCDSGVKWKYFFKVMTSDQSLKTNDLAETNALLRNPYGPTKPQTSK